MGLRSLTIPFEIMDQDLSPISDLLLPPTVEFLAIDNYYCGLLMGSSSYSQKLTNTAVGFVQSGVLSLPKKPCLTPTG
jgi:hypothetical protein